MVADGQWLTFVALFLPFFAAAAAPLITSRLGHNASWVLALAPALIFLHFAAFAGAVADGETIAGGISWIPSLGVDFSWYLDGLSLTFALLISGIGTLIVLYSGGSLAGHPQQGRFFSFILMFMGAMQGLVVSDSFLTLFVFWELTSIASFLLIGFDHGREAARRAALQALIVTSAGGLSLLAGLLIISGATEANAFSDLLSQGVQLGDAPIYTAALLLILGGAFTKSAQFPFHFWLPNAMEAPTPVSAYLHSATMVKAGVYLIMRLNPVLGETFAWETILPVFGGATLAVGAFLALRQTDLKLMLAYTTVASLGLLVMLTGFGSTLAIEAAVLYLVAHSMFKGALFMVSGAIDQATGTRDVTELGGIGRAMPITFAAALLAALSMGGLPPFFGFLAKEEIYASLAAGGGWGFLLMLVALVGNALMLAVALAVGLKPFIGAKTSTPKEPQEGSVLLWAGPAALAACGLFAALFSSFSHRFVTSPMASAVVGAPVEISVSWIPHLGIPFLLSLLTVALGIGFYVTLDRGREAMAALLAGIGWGPDRGFDQLVQASIRWSSAVTKTVHNGRLDIYMTVTFAALAVSLFVPMLGFGELPDAPRLASLRFYEWTVLAIALIGLGAVIYARDRLTAIACLGIQGFAVALLFMLMGAPDLSFTQFMVETLSVVILAMVMTRLRLYPADRRPASQKLLDFSIAGACGLGFALILLRIVQQPFDATLSTFFAENSLAIAHGRNIVNVIIVDFRGLDTLGEISVVMIAGLAILALVRIRAGRPKEKAIREEAELT